MNSIQMDIFSSLQEQNTHAHTYFYINICLIYDNSMMANIIIVVVNAAQGSHIIYKLLYHSMYVRKQHATFARFFTQYVVWIDLIVNCY